MDTGEVPDYWLPATGLNDKSKRKANEVPLNCLGRDWKGLAAFKLLMTAASRLVSFEDSFSFVSPSVPSFCMANSMTALVFFFAAAGLRAEGGSRNHAFYSGRSTSLFK